MALLLIPIFILSLAYTIQGIFNVRYKLRLCLIVLLGMIVMGLTFPMIIILLDSFAGGFIENQLSILWSAARQLTIAEGDINIGASGFLLVVMSAVFIVLQIMLIRANKPV